MKKPAKLVCVSIIPVLAFVGIAFQQRNRDMLKDFPVLARYHPTVQPFNAGAFELRVKGHDAPTMIYTVPPKLADEAVDAFAESLEKDKRFKPDGGTIISIYIDRHFSSSEYSVTVEYPVASKDGSMRVMLSRKPTGLDLKLKDILNFFRR